VSEGVSEGGGVEDMMMVGSQVRSGQDRSGQLLSLIGCGE
jgi:hypothetical protein